MTTSTKRQVNKRVWDWHELTEAVSSQRRLNKQTEVSDVALKRAAMRTSTPFVAQLDERVVAAATPERIDMLYLYTERGTALEDSRLCHWVSVYPAAGGRTTYCIDDAVSGWFANSHLPINASDRRTRSQYQSKQWHYGQAGVYQKGTGPYYPDVGPECANLTLEQLIDAIKASTDEEGSQTSEQWRDAACSVAERVANAVAPFKDTVVRYEPVGIGERRGRFSVGGRVYRSDDWDPSCELESSYGLFIRLKSPAVSHDGGGSGWHMTPDFVVAVSGPLLAYEDPPNVTYGAWLAHPQGRLHCTECCPTKEVSTGLEFTASRSPVRIIEAARQWAASRIYIPCS